ncbi:CDP-glycerol glycerophosphotransferase family protein [Leucobacter soli]|uniref:Glycosyl/glycerophosphate transferase n=1 Tax=Leucobacter soli TaxID=2812850 RepID=A0A916JT75_9MICO|nr:CDP-glycerol glycerophosphotransferase family protein [Leucobacter soli]CAG7601437.1 hypothetical protein LEUCIP111803_00463 [Leucobacter soli]
MTTTARFGFASGNLAKIWAVPKYVFGFILSWFVPRDRSSWIFGSGIGVGEGALAVARELQRRHPETRVVWAVADEEEAESARSEGFEPVLRHGRAGFRAALRAGVIVVTHGLGDVNRFGVTGARIVHLGHGTPLKLLHLDASVTTTIGGPELLRALLRRMYLLGSRSVDLYVAGSAAGAARLRTAYRVAPGRVRALGDPRDDVVADQARDPRLAARARADVRRLLELPVEEETASVTRDEPIILYAPTWRDGEPDPGVPTAAEVEEIHRFLARRGARLAIRPHRLGLGAYEHVLGERVHALGPGLLRDVTPVLGAFDAVITDYSSLAVDFSLLGEPIVWFAPDLERYTASRGLYEPLEVTATGRIQRAWSGVLQRLEQVVAAGEPARAAAQADTRALAERFHAYTDGGSAARVVEEVLRLGLPAHERIRPGGVFFESFYGRQIACNPLAIDREIAARLPELPRYWSVHDERIAVPDGATPLLVGGPDWIAARRLSRLLVVNDWLRFGFRRRTGQTVLQTWHGTMLKHLALGRPGVGLRTRLAIHRESRRWDLLLSQNRHSSERFRSEYAYRGEILELGYPRDDRLARATAAPPAGREGAPERIRLAIDAARRALGVPTRARVLVYAPTWREDVPVGGTGGGAVDLLDVRALAAELAAASTETGEEWLVVARGHTRTHDAGGYGIGESRVIDASRHPDVNDVILAADLLITDYSSVMFDAAVARVPMAFFVPDLVDYRDRERGFTFDFEASAPGPLLATRAQLVDAVRSGDWRAYPCSERYDAWCARFLPHEDGGASERVVDALIERRVLPAGAAAETEDR